MLEIKTLPWAGEDPLADDQNERDINSVAGVLKLYFRGLENPLFPKERFQDLISTISKYMWQLFSANRVGQETMNGEQVHLSFANSNLRCKKGYRSAMEAVRKRH